MSARLLPVLRQRYFDANGAPLSGGKLYSYRSGTTTLAATYTDQAGLVPNANPVVLDANGEANVWLGAGTYKFVLKDADDVTQWTQDDVSVEGDSGDPGDLTVPWFEHAITDGQAATNLSGETVDFAQYTSAIYEVEIIRGTTIIANGRLTVQNLNGAARVRTSYFDDEHGVTFSVTLASQTAQLRAACSSGLGNGSIKLKQTLVPA